MKINLNKHKSEEGHMGGIPMALMIYGGIASIAYPIVAGYKIGSGHNYGLHPSTFIPGPVLGTIGAILLSGAFGCSGKETAKGVGGSILIYSAIEAASFGAGYGLAKLLN